MLSYLILINNREDFVATSSNSG